MNFDPALRFIFSPHADATKIPAPAKAQRSAAGTH